MTFATHQSALVEWDLRDGVLHCTPTVVEANPATAFAVGTVHDPRSRPGPFEVQGCRSRVTTSVDGTFRIPLSMDEPCRIWARRAGEEFGVGTLFTPVAGDTQIWVSTTPEPLRILSADVVVADRALRVVHSDWTMGLSVGDLLVAVDGARLGPNPFDEVLLALRSGAHHALLVRRGDTVIEVEVSTTYRAPATE